MAQNIPHKIAPLAAAFAALTFSISIHAVSFEPIKTQTVDLDPRGLASGNLNNDGVPDLVSVNNDAGNVSVLLGKTDNSGDFDPAVNTAVGTGPFSVAIGDVLGAGTNEDIVVAKWGLSGGDNEITILVGNGDGTFAAPIALNPAPTPALEDPRDVILADIDNDGDLDIIVAQWGVAMGAGPSVRIFLNGNSSTNFPESPTSPFTSGAFPFGLVHADATGDGISDLVLANVGASNTVSILIGENAGTTFTNSFTVATGATPFTVAVADLDGINGPDLAVANSGDNTISVLLSEGDTSMPADGINDFLPKVDTPVGTNPQGIAIANISGDSNLDVVVTNETSNNISVLEGDGTGGFTGAAAPFPAGTTPSPLVVDDFDSDGNVDVAVANIGPASTSVSVLINDANQAPSFTSTPVTAATQDALYTYNITTTDPNAGDTVAITAPTLPAWLTLTDNGDGTATLTGTPGVANLGANPVELLVTDDGTGNLTGSQSFTVTVAAINEAPSFTSTPVTAATQDAAYSYSITTTDPNAGDTVAITAPTLPAWLTLTDNGDGTATLTGTPDGTNLGANPVELLVTDDGTGNLTGSQPFTVTVATNEAPSFTSTPVTAATQDAAYSYNITTTDPNAGDTVAITAPTLPAWLTLTDNGDGTATLTGTPDGTNLGANPVELLVTDDGAGNLTGSQPFTVTVAAPTTSSSGGGGGGCTLNTAGSTAKDPLMPLLLVAAMAALYRRRNRKSIKGS